MSQPVSASGDEGRRGVGRGLLCHAGTRGAGEAALRVSRGQLLPSSILCRDSVLSAVRLMLLNTSAEPPL